MNVAVIIAGGVGKRMGEDIPKQFIEIDGKPVIVYTLQGFEEHSDIDAIEIVCVEGWQDYLKKKIAESGLTKIKWIIKGGDSVQESIKNGVDNLKGKVSDDDVIVIHDGVRPLVDEFVLTDVIKVCKEKGNAVTSMPYNEQIFVIDDEESTVKYIPRETLRRVSTPQAYKFKKLYESYKKAFESGIGIHGTSYTNTMMVDLGERLYFSKGSDKNIKLTTKGDLLIFKSLIKAKKEKL